MTVVSKDLKAAAAGERSSDPWRNSVVKESYFSPEYVDLEYRRLWPRVWQMACREEELVEVGDYVTYDIGNESILVVRSESDRLQAFHNVCRHRGRRLTEGRGQLSRIRCGFHGWRWKLDGTNENVTLREDWRGCLRDDDLRLQAVRLETWGGFVFVNLDTNAEPLLNYLGEVAEALAPFELDKMRYRWRKWLKMPVNWKVALEAFNEGYHVSTTHWPLNQFGTSTFSSRAAGRHGTFGGDTSTLRPESSANTAASSKDLRRALAGLYHYLQGAIDSNMTETMVHAAQTLPATVPDDAPPEQVVGTLMQTSMAIDAARGVQWPKITREQYVRGGIDWHIFPNTVLLPMATNCLGYRSRPDYKNPASCIFEVYQLERMPPDAKLEVENLRNDDILDTAFWGEILLQDFQQMQATFRGIQSSSYRGPLLNPKQEVAIDNFHRIYHEYLKT